MNTFINAPPPPLFIQSGLKKGWRAFLWMIKLIVPISLCTAIADWSGVVEKLHFIIEPAMSIFGLPAKAALPLLIGMLTNIYGGIASMAVLGLTVGQMTLIAVFLLIAHNLIQEGIIQGASGFHPLKAAAVRIFSASVTILAMRPFIDMSGSSETSGTALLSHTFSSMLLAWGKSTFRLSIKIFLIIMCIMILMEWLKSSGVIYHISKALSPFLTFMGLSRNSGVLWLTALIFGLAYGGAVIVEEAKTGQLSKDELEALQISIGVNHSVLEDPLLFVPFGINIFWLWIPRVITAFVVVRLFAFFRTLFGRTKPAPQNR